MNRRNVLLIINAGSSSGDSPELAQSIKMMEEAGIRVRRVDSTSADHARREINRQRDKTDLVVLAGGDGTLHSAAQALLQSGLPFAVLPLGTGNDLARSLEIPVDLQEATRMVIDDCRKRIDVGKANGRPFFNAVNIGLGVTINHQLTADDKKSWGVLSYLKALLASLTRQRSFRVKFTIDGQTYQMRSVQVAVGNGRFYGGGNIIDEDASIDEGLLHVYSIAPQSFWQLLLLAPFLRFGKKRRAANFFKASGRDIHIETSRPMEVFTDGEPATQTPLSLQVMPAAIEAVTRPKASPDPLGTQAAAA